MNPLWIAVLVVVGIIILAIVAGKGLFGKKVKGFVLKQWHSVGQWFRRLRGRLASFIARKIITKRICYYVLVRVWANATTGEWSNEPSASVTVFQAAERWDKRYHVA